MKGGRLGPDQLEDAEEGKTRGQNPPPRSRWFVGLVDEESATWNVDIQSTLPPFRDMELQAPLLFSPPCRVCLQRRSFFSFRLAALVQSAAVLLYLRHGENAGRKPLILPAARTDQGGNEQC